MSAKKSSFNLYLCSNMYKLLTLYIDLLLDELPYDICFYYKYLFSRKRKQYFFFWWRLNYLLWWNHRPLYMAVRESIFLKRATSIGKPVGCDEWFVKYFKQSWRKEDSIPLKENKRYQRMFRQRSQKAKRPGFYGNRVMQLTSKTKKGWSKIKCVTCTS